MPGRPRAIGCVGPLLLLAACSLAQEGLDFERPETGWQVVAGSARWEKGQAGQGQRCLALESATDRAWVVSEPLARLEPGKATELSVLAKRVAGEGELALALLADVAEPAGPVLWEGVPHAEGGWHRLALQVICGISKARLAVGVVGKGTWLVDDIRLAPARLAPVTRPVPAELVPRYPESLSVDAVVEGDLDLQKRTILGAESWFLQVGQVTLQPERQATVQRGERTGVVIEAVARGAGVKRLRTEVIGPPGWRNEPSLRTVKGQGEFGLEVPIQALLAGDARIKLRVECNGDVREMPLAVTVRRYYPALGVLWEGAAPSEAELAACALMPAQFHQVWLAPGQEPAGLGGVAASGADLGLTWQGGLHEALAGISKLPVSVRSAVVAAGLERATLDDQQQLCVAVRALQPEATVLSPAYRLHQGPDGLTESGEVAAAVDQGLAQWADVLAVRLPGLPGAAVLRETVDGHARPGPMAAWQYFDQTWSLRALRELLRSKGAALPIFAELAGNRSTGDEALDAYLVARVVLHVFSSGANGVAVAGRASKPGEVALCGTPEEAHRALLSVYGELTRELAGVRTLVPPPATAVAGDEPGKPVTFRHFMRGDEGIVALWNNTAQPQGVAVELRATPREVRLLRISYPGALVQREYIAEFNWDALARHWGQPAVYVDLAPLQVVILSLRMRDMRVQWLREVGAKPPSPPEVHPMDRAEFEKRLYGPPEPGKRSEP